ncbi:hypothetical protein CGRA01v4_08897 [Colletotrichum graminicola]|nr:hypothetical protein CGRA01v4_08897 [Colletotrichum graminicola]
MELLLYIVCARRPGLLDSQVAVAQRRVRVPAKQSPRHCSR